MRQCYLDLVEKVRRIDPAAADYLMGDEITQLRAGHTQAATIDCVMNWSSTPQGYEYWSDLCDKVGRLPPVPDLFDC